MGDGRRAEIKTSSASFAPKRFYGAHRSVKHSFRSHCASNKMYILYYIYLVRLHYNKRRALVSPPRETSSSASTSCTSCTSRALRALFERVDSGRDSAFHSACIFSALASIPFHLFPFAIFADDWLRRQTAPKANLDDAKPKSSSHRRSLQESVLRFFTRSRKRIVLGTLCKSCTLYFTCTATDDTVGYQKGMNHISAKCSPTSHRLHFNLEIVFDSWMVRGAGIPRKCERSRIANGTIARERTH